MTRPAIIPAPRYPSREAWLAAAVNGMTPWFAQALAPLPAVRVAIGFPSSGRGSSAIGECWSRDVAADGINEIWIAPQYGRGQEAMVATILLHELTHAAVGLEAGHGPVFARVARALGLGGQLTTWNDETVTGRLGLRLFGLCYALGPMPHGAHRLHGSGAPRPGTDGPLPRPRCPKPGRPPQVSRQVKCACVTCGYIARTTRLWIERAGPPVCPTDAIPMVASAR